MPDRIVRAGILDSRAVNALSAEGEVFYRRLLSLVDDFGRYEADPELLQVKLFWRQIDRWPVDKVLSVLESISKCPRPDVSIGKRPPEDVGPLVTLYTCSGRRYLQVENVGKPRALRSKYPSPVPEPVVVCEHVQTSETSVRYTKTNTTTKEVLKHWRPVYFDPSTITGKSPAGKP